MEACIPQSSAVIVQRVPREATEQFRQWQRDVTEVAKSFAGFEGTDVYPPTAEQIDEWVTLIHFENAPTLQHWLDSPERAVWVERLRATVGDFELKRLNGGFSLWFAGIKSAAAAPPLPAWKMALTVLLGLYPTVLLLTLVVGPFTAPLGFAISMLIGNALSVALLQWVVVPCLMRVLRPWLAANASATRGLSCAGVGLILASLLGLAAFYQALVG
ncbi:MAG TPA: antibiotic biosynthesis monooxygenase [Pirellulaceae bacterium]|nr:antibiotic biosynthesis monooxygenase [Pirellulaceae bacterium]